MTKKELAQILADEAPQGWVVTQGDGYHGGFVVWEKSTASWVRFERKEEGVDAAIVLNVMDPDRNSKWVMSRTYRRFQVEGHTTVNQGNFTRSGIDGYSVKLAETPEGYRHEYPTLAKLLEGEYERCRKAAESDKKAESVPGLPFSRQPEWFKAAAKQLKASKAVTLTPAGFGTGYTLRTKARKPLAVESMLGIAPERAKPELEARLGVSPIWIETFDHD